LISISDFEGQRFLILNNQASDLEKKEFEKNLKAMNEIMARHVKFLKDREEEMESAMSSVLNAKKEMDDLANSMDQEMQLHSQIMEAIYVK